jgi:hypothetical protein
MADDEIRRVLLNGHTILNVKTMDSVEYNFIIYRVFLHCCVFITFGIASLVWQWKSLYESP